ncbi:c-type cytochrome [Catenovulum sp. 2E275]|uniref:c-type cytochrome n=1 Tax=Catenovulum sp. 2E275 TaxID=2980497 RepID=UPI0021D0B9CC|nr:c-type cytochrome [Catenovulum sp. 2E275]MCU4677194.1 c-type cytochrome [Catenovulum sp. 2E275]
MRMNMLQKLAIFTTKTQSLKLYACLLLRMFILAVPTLYSSSLHASEIELSGVWYGYDRSNFRGELRHISLDLSSETSHDSTTARNKLGPFKALKQSYVAMQGKMGTSRPVQRIRSGRTAIVEQFDIAGRYYPQAQFFILSFHAKGQYGSATPQTAVLSADGNTMAFFPALGQPWLLTKTPEQHQKIHLLAKIQHAAPYTADINQFKNQLLSTNTLPEQQVDSLLNRANTLIEQYAQAIYAGEIAALNNLRQTSIALRTELNQARAAAMKQQRNTGITSTPATQLQCPENILAWANEVPAQGSSHQQYNGPAEIANLFRDKIFSSHFGAPFLAIEAQDIGRYALQISKACSRNDKLRHSRLFPSMATAFKDPGPIAVAGFSRFDAASGALALETLEQWLERITAQNHTGANYQASDMEIILTELGKNLWPAKAESLKASGKNVGTEQASDIPEVPQQIVAKNPFPSTNGLQQKDKYQICISCHATGVNNAPKIGDSESWKAPISLGIGQLLTSVKQGKGHMPAMGGCENCSDEEILQFIATMLASTVKSSDSSQEKITVSRQKKESFLKRYGLYTMTLEDVWINNQKNQCGDLQPGSNLLGKFTNPNHPSFTPFTAEEVTIMRALNSGRAAIGVKIQGENFFDLSNQKLLGINGWSRVGIELKNGKVVKEDHDFVFLCLGTGTKAEKLKIAEKKAQQMREKCPLCELPGAIYLDAIYRADYQKQLYEGRSVLMSFARDNRSLGLSTIMRTLTSRRELTLLEEVIGYYMLKYSLEKDDCFTEGKFQKTFTTHFPGYRIINDYGVEEQRVDPSTVKDVYQVPLAFEQACNAICNQQGGISIISQYLENNDFTREVGDIFSGISQLVHKHACQSPIRKEFEHNLLKLWQQEKRQPNNTKPTVKNAFERVNQFR